MNDETTPAGPATLVEDTLRTSFRAADTRPDPLAIARGRLRLLDHATGQGPGRAGARRGPVFGRVAVGAGLTAATLVAVVAVPALTGSGGASATAAETLQRAAAVAVTAAPPEQPGPGQFRYTRHVERQLQVVGSETGVEVGPECSTLIETWGPGPGSPSGAGSERRVDGATAESALAAAVPAVFAPGCLYQEDSTGPLPEPSTTGDWTTPDAAFVAGLPTDPEQLHARARDDARDYDDRDQGTMSLLRDLALSRSPHVTPELAGAVLRAIALVPGVEETGPAANLFGEPGTAIGYTDREVSQRDEFIVDPSTGRVLGERVVATEGDPLAPAGTVIFESGTRTGVVAADGERPPS